MVLAGFLIAFCAGAVVGISSKHGTLLSSNGTESSGPTTRQNHQSWLAQQLNLTAQQVEQLNVIWSDVTHSGDATRDQRRQLRKDREDAIAALVRPEDHDTYQKILDNYTKGSEDIDKQMHETFASAIDRTKAILTAEQRTKYEEILSHNQWDRDRGGRGDHGDRGGPDQHGMNRQAGSATSRPADKQ
jgi:Spy/CpxP family protein refolding chaperone